MQPTWTAVDNYLKQHLVKPDVFLQQTLAFNIDYGLPPHDVSPLQGQFLGLMVQISGAKQILEIGTLGGFSTQFMARALPEDGKLISLEKNATSADIARQNIKRSHLEDKVTIIVGDAADTLPTMEAWVPFDMIFIDADKQNSLLYLDWAMKLSRLGSLIIMDNIVRGGTIIDEQRDPHAEGIRQALNAIKNNDHLSATAFQTVGEKGWDGFALLRVTKVPT
ncbi:O-methyltransferase [Photorhabdus viridis]|uniref:O-methyltransferase n=1 Tax=Photorhabdus viridis TaxID=3163327 RepID=UPI003306EA03